MFQLLFVLITFSSGFLFSHETNQWKLARRLLPEGFPGSAGPTLGAEKYLPKSSAKFQPNLGQAPSNIDFVAKSNGYRMYVTGTNLVFDMLSPDEGHPGVQPGLITVSLMGAQMMLAGRGEDKREVVTNYLYGSDPSKWVYDVPTYSKVRYEAVYPGIDLVFYGNGDRAMEHDFIVSPGADYHDIKLEIKGAKALSITPKGDIKIEAMGGGALKLKKPLVYQTTGAGVKLEIPSHYELDGHQLSFWVDEEKYDKSLDLVIDPVTVGLVDSSYLGGSSDDVPIAVARYTAEHYRYVTGYTKSSSYPTASTPQQSSSGGGTDAFVSMIQSSSGTAGNLTYSTYYGGNGTDVGTTIWVDSVSNNILVGGYTTSTNFPTTGTVSAPLSTSTGDGTYNGFVARVSSDLKFTGCVSGQCFSAYLGGSGFDTVMGVTLDATSTTPTCTTSGKPCLLVVGTTSTSSSFATGSPFQDTYGGGSSDAFVARITTDSTVTVDKLSYYGGSGTDTGIAIASETSGTTPNYFVAGQTNSSSGINYGTTVGTSFSGVRDGFVAKIPNGFTTPTWGTYVGGSGRESMGGLAIDPTSAATAIYVIGTTTSSSINSATGTNSNGTAYSAGKDIFIADLNSDASAFNYLTFIGGSSDDDVPGIQSIAIDSGGVAWFVGRTASTSLTTTASIKSPGFSTFPSGASRVGLFGRLGSGSATVSALSYFGNASGDDALTAVTPGSSSQYPMFVGYMSETGSPLAGTTTRTYTGSKDILTPTGDYTSTGCGRDSAASCQDGTSVYTNNNLFTFTVRKIIGAATANVETSNYDYGSQATVPWSASTLTPFSAGATVTGTNLYASDSYALLNQMSNPTNANGPLGAFPTSVSGSMITSGYTSYRFSDSTTQGTSTATGYNGFIDMNQSTLSCCTNTSDIHYVSASGTTNGGSSGGSLTYALAVLPSGYTLLGGGAYISSNSSKGGSFIFASYPAKHTGSEVFAGTTFGLKLSDNNCLYSSLQPLVTNTGGGTAGGAGTGGGSVSPTALSSAGCNAWAAASRDSNVANGATMTAYAIGIKSTLLPTANVYVSAAVTTGAGITAGVTATNSCTMSSPYVLINGGTHAIWDAGTQYLQENYLAAIGGTFNSKIMGAFTAAAATAQIITYCIGVSP